MGNVLMRFASYGDLEKFYGTESLFVRDYDYRPNVEGFFFNIRRRAKRRAKLRVEHRLSKRRRSMERASVNPNWGMF